MAGNCRRDGSSCRSEEFALHPGAAGQVVSALPLRRDVRSSRDQARPHYQARIDLSLRCAGSSWQRWSPGLSRQPVFHRKVTGASCRLPLSRVADDGQLVSVRRCFGEREVGSAAL